MSKYEPKEKQELIRDINGLYPIDSQYPDTADIGKRLLMESILEVPGGWRDLPEGILNIYLEKCIAEDNKT